LDAFRVVMAATLSADRPQGMIKAYRLAIS
jgi:hypothetical protein